MSLFITLFITLILSVSTDKTLKKMNADAVLSAAHSLTVSIKINEAHDAIELDLVGPSDIYYAVGFGSTVMLNTWAVIVNGDGEDGWFERTLSNHRPGLERKAKSFEML